MSLFLLLLALSQPGVCEDTRPGLSKCVEYRSRIRDAGKVTEWDCDAVCYWPSTRKTDGGTTGEKLTPKKGPHRTKAACLQDLESQCAARQRLAGS